MAATKTAYTDEQAVILRDAYVANPTKETVEALAVQMGKTVRSIVAKLSNMGIYQKAEYVGKNGEKPVKKEEIASQFMERFNLTEAEADSLAKANKSALLKILAAFDADGETVVE